MAAHVASGPTSEDLFHPLLISADLRAGRVTVTGELDRASAHLLLNALETLTLSDPPDWTVDAEGITFCDVDGMRVLASAQSSAQDRGRTLLLVRAKPFLINALTVVGLNRLVDRSPPGPTVAQRDGSARDRAGDSPRQPEMA